MSDKSTEIRQGLLNHIESQVVFGDAKATLLIAADALLITAYLSGLKDFPAQLSRWSVGLLVFALLLTLVGLLLSLATVRPAAMHFKHLKEEPLDKLVLFSRIACFSTSREYIDEFNQLSDGQLDDMLLAGVYGRSRWALAKYGLLKRAIYATMGSVVLAGVAMTLTVFK